MLRLSIDSKAAIKIGPYSRGGYNRHGARAADHDFEPEAIIKLFGIHIPQIDENHFYFTTSNVTADFMVDALQELWPRIKQLVDPHTIVINADNGVILNSTPLNKKSDEEIFDKYMEMANQAGPKASIIALTMDKNGVPQDIDTRVAIAAEIVSKAMEKGFDSQRLFIDPIILPVKVPNAQVQPGNILSAMDQIKYLSEPAPHMTIGLSNLSQGATERSLINRVFLAMAISRGLDSAIVDVLDVDLMNIVATAEMLMNKQIYSDSFLKVYATVNKT